MSYTTGKSKSLDDIVLDDVLKYPIWVWATDEEEVPEQDETWQKPVIDTTDVSEELYYSTISLKIKDTEYYASAVYQPETISAICVWLGTEWGEIRELPDLPSPLIFVAIPSIRGVKDAMFICYDPAIDKAKRFIITG